jgi:outer membrane scaffolding protein for murein synthesis (MipA/OmpV family)
MSSNRNCLLGLAAASMLALQSGDAAADSLTLGLGAGFAPQFTGSTDYQAFPLPSFSYETESFTVETSELGVLFDFIPGPGFGAGPIVQYSFGRVPDDIDNEVVSKLPQVDDAIQVGGFLSGAIPIAEMGQSPLFLTGRVEALSTVGANYDGVTANASVGLFTMAGKWSMGANFAVNYANEDQMQAFFGVTEKGSAASGLPTFEASAGLESVGVEAFVGYEIDEKWSVSAFGSYSQLTGDAADSPIVEFEGTQDQYFIGTAISYKVF